MTSLLLACAGDSYDPDWDPNGPVGGGKADGLLDILQVLTFGDSVSGEVGGTRVELYVIDLKRTDRIELAMEVTSGDLDPHLSFFYGTSTYVGSESWSRSGNTLKKIYLAENAGRYLIAVRAYQNQGAGSYTLRVTCKGGPCAGEAPPPEVLELDADDVAACISRIRRCAFAKLPQYNGAVGPARSKQLMLECAAQSSLSDGSSCVGVCDWKGPDNSWDADDAAPLCAEIEQSLPFYADASQACLAAFDSCMGTCYSYGNDSWYGDEGLFGSSEAMCFAYGFNGNCNSFARSLDVCGGSMPSNSARACTAECESTTGAYIDDLDTLCSSDSDCDDYCDVDLAEAGAACGGLTAANAACLRSWMDDNDAWICEDALNEQIGTP